MATPPTQVADILSTGGWNATGASDTCTSITTQVGDVLVIRGMTADGNRTMNTPTNSGTAETWTLRQSVVVSQYSTIYLWTAVAATAQTMAPTVGTSSGGSVPMGFRLAQFRGSTGVGASNKTNVASGAPSLTLTTTGANSAVLCANSDWSAVDGTTRTWRTVDGSPIVELGYYRDAAQYSNYSGWIADSQAAGAKVVGLSAPAGQKYSIAAIEIFGGAGGPTPYPFGVTTPTPRYR